ncbi:hypothetical protein [Vagococcus lutrae]|uniref:hypothetical protein n=1 Tax=Vagococcus lutrae TaxID=81947 RepID=UPI00288FC61D|nr:hypothetical protein [Vagococcus lutrae]MDT2844651.1 hypothetical protein [Vagococcus lutrae]
MFDFNSFIIENLTNGYANGSFTKEQVNIFAMNYLMRGQLTKESFDFILSEIERIKEEKLNENAVAEPPMIEGTQEQEESDVESSER